MIPSSSSQQILTETRTDESEQQAEEVIPLHLRAPHQSSTSTSRVRWAEDTIDNEHMNKKKSKSKLFSILIIGPISKWSQRVLHIS